MPTTTSLGVTDETSQPSASRPARRKAALLRPPTRLADRLSGKDEVESQVFDRKTAPRSLSFLPVHSFFISTIASSPRLPALLCAPRCFEVTRVITADADYEQKPSLAEEIERRELLGEDRMARRQHKRAGAELHVIMREVSRP